MDVEEQIYNEENKIPIPLQSQQKKSTDYVFAVKELEKQIAEYKKLAVEQDKLEKYTVDKSRIGHSNGWNKFEHWTLTLSMTTIIVQIIILILIYLTR